jgi:nucleotide-binding universal stress UspA family protein
MSIFPTRILFATDGSEDAALATTAAADLTKSTSSELHVVHVGPEYPYYELPEAPARFEELVAAQRREAQGLLDEQVGRVEELGATVTEAHLAKAERPERAIVDLGESLAVGLVVVGSRGRGPLRRALMGSVSDSVVRYAHCPVLVVRGSREGASLLGTTILLAVDDSEEAANAARAAVELADATGSGLHVVHVGEVAAVYHPERHGYRSRYDAIQEEARRLLDEQVDSVKAAGGTVAQAHLAMGRPDEEIVALGEELGAGLIAVGSRGLGGIRRALMGSVSESVVHHAYCPVLVVRQEKS